jgi:hypothetical protein
LGFVKRLKEFKDREFFAAIREGREPNSGIAQVLPCYQVLDGFTQQLSGILRWKRSARPR